jgi:hypothetical protein
LFNEKLVQTGEHCTAHPCSRKEPAYLAIQKKFHAGECSSLEKKAKISKKSDYQNQGGKII